MAGKWLELLKQIAPRVTRAAVFRDPGNPSGIGQFAANGTLDGFNPGANGKVNALAVQADGKVLVGGEFNMLAGAIHGRLARFTADDVIDPSFNPSIDDGAIQTLAVQADGADLGEILEALVRQAVDRKA